VIYRWRGLLKGFGIVFDSATEEATEEFGVPLFDRVKMHAYIGGNYG